MEFSKSAEKFLKKVDSSTTKKIYKALDGIPSGKNVTKLHLNNSNKLDNYYRIKIEHYRIIFNRIGNNDDIYVKDIMTKSNAKYRKTGCYF